MIKMYCIKINKNDHMLMWAREKNSLMVHMSTHIYAHVHTCTQTQMKTHMHPNMNENAHPPKH